MPLNLNDEEANQLERVERRVSERLARLAADLTAYPVLDDRSPDEILGFETRGHFGPTSKSHKAD